MKKYFNKVIVTIIILLLFLVIFFLTRKMSLNNYLNKTIEKEYKINYSTNIVLSINDSKRSSVIEYNIIRSSGVKKIVISNYIDDKLNNRISKYIVNNGNKKGTYKYNGSKYIRSEEKEDFIIDYNKLKNSIINIKKIDNEVINDVSYKKYIVSMKAYDAYNLLYGSNILSKGDIKNNIDVSILIDKLNNFVYKISYKIDNINNSNKTDEAMEYNVEIVNTDINNNDVITLPF